MAARRTVAWAAAFDYAPRPAAARPFPLVGLRPAAAPLAVAAPVSARGPIARHCATGPYNSHGSFHQVPWMDGEKAKRRDGYSLLELLRRMPRLGTGCAVRKVTWGPEMYVRVTKVRPNCVGKGAEIEGFRVRGGRTAGGKVIRERMLDRPKVQTWNTLRPCGSETRKVWKPLVTNFLDRSGISGWRKGPLSGAAVDLEERTRGSGFIHIDRPDDADAEDGAGADGASADGGAETAEDGEADAAATAASDDAQTPQEPSLPQVWYAHPHETLLDRTSDIGWRRGVLSAASADLVRRTVGAEVLVHANGEMETLTEVTN